MYENIYSKEKQILSNGEMKLSKNQFTKSLTSFHTKKPIQKNILIQNQIKKSYAVKNKRIYLSR